LPNLAGAIADAARDKPAFTNHQRVPNRPDRPRSKPGRLHLTDRQADRFGERVKSFTHCESSGTIANSFDTQLSNSECASRHRVILFDASMVGVPTKTSSIRAPTSMAQYLEPPKLFP
jgi:hypothetical protein